MHSLALRAGKWRVRNPGVNRADGPGIALAFPYVRAIAPRTQVAAPPPMPTRSLGTAGEKGLPVANGQKTTLRLL